MDKLKYRECNQQWCKDWFKKKGYKWRPHYHLEHKVKFEDVKKGVSGCCLSSVHMETSSRCCCLACKKCGYGLSGAGVIIFIDKLIKQNEQTK